jgi:hypothetical protein
LKAAAGALGKQAANRSQKFVAEAYTCIWFLDPTQDIAGFNAHTAFQNGKATGKAATSR